MDGEPQDKTPKQYFVTDRPYKVDNDATGDPSIATIFHFEDDWGESLPPNAVVLNIGSGIHRNF